jgi:hypothetical protein
MLVIYHACYHYNNQKYWNMASLSPGAMHHTTTLLSRKFTAGPGVGTLPLFHECK